MDGIDANTLLLWRAVERFASVAIGGLAIYLGYRLFMSLEQRVEEGEAKLFLPGDVSVYVGRVGPGIFFAMFGAGILIMSFLSPLNVVAGGTPGPAAGVEAAAAASGAAQSEGGDRATASISYVSGEVDAARFRSDRANVQRDLLTLRKLEGSLDEYLDAEAPLDPGTAEAANLLNTLHRVKRLMMLSVWDEGWGDPRAFGQWVQSGAPDPVPPGLENAAPLFRGTSL